MNKLKSTKFIILLTVLAFLFGGVGVSLAQLDTTSSESIPSSIDEKDANIIGTPTVLTEELNAIEKSIEKVSEQIDFIDEGTAKQEQQFVVEKEINSKVDSLGIISKEDVQIQVKDLLRRIKEKDIYRIEDVEKEKLEKTNSLLDDKNQKSKEEKEDKENLETEEKNTNTNTEEEIFNELDEGIIIAEKNIEDAEKDIENLVLEKKRKIIERASTKKAFEDTLKDSDDDGISDFDEVTIYGTDPFSADSDGDGYLDGVEVISGFNPKDSSSDAIVVYENPKESGVVEDSLFSIGKIEVVSNIDTDSEITGDSTNSVGKMLFEGQSLPNSFVTLYIFSIPTVVTVKTDKEGNWSYTMDKELENGDHEIYVAMTDNSGKIITKSKPIPFVKEAFAVTVDDELLSLQIDGNKPSFLNFGYLYITILILVFLLGVVLTIIGVRLNFRKEENTEDVY